MLLALGPLKTDYLSIKNGQQQQRNRTYKLSLLLKYMPRSLRPTLERIRPAKLLVTDITGPEWLWILTAIYRTITTTIRL